MKIQMLFGLLFFGIVQASVAAQCPGDQMSNGWCWPTMTSSIGNYLGWHGDNPGFSGNHLAQDIDADEGTDVYSIANNGIAVESRNNVGYYGGATNCNSDGSVTGISGGGVIVRYMTSNNESFDVLYAHLKNINVSKNETVNINTKIGEIRSYIWCGSRMDHLHFGIRFPANNDGNLWAGYGNTDKGFVNPMNFLDNYFPHISTSTGYRFISEQDTYGNTISVSWAPADVPCDKASVWSYNETCSAEYSNVGTCQLAYDELKDMDFWKYSGDDWNTIFFGSTSDFQDLCY